ncbi:MAG: DUF2779 domain-containing protein [Erysipelotrichaceae bacterium]|nr:DUF2779 domain-containing protein [Erysipelotrichaceae bacterium]
MYHISDIKRFLRCERLYYYSKDENNVFKPYLRSDENFSDLLKKFLGIEECYEGIRNDPADRFFQEIDHFEWFIHPRFMDGQMRVNVPLMHKKGDLFDLYFVYYGTLIRELDLLTYRISVKVLERQGIRVDDVYLIYLNEDYTNDGQLDPEKLFICTDVFKKQRIRDLIRKEEVDYDACIRQMESFTAENVPATKCRFCKLNGLCDYYDRCFPDEEKEADDSILTLVSSQNKNRMYRQGIRSLKDADPELLEGNKVQYAQIMASRNGGVFLDRYPLQQWLEKLSDRPISFIDFEWDRYLIPAYEKMKPMDVVCFEFALYYIDEEGHMEHRTFVGTEDCRREFVEALLQYLPEKGPILAYNAQGAECLRLIELSQIYPEYEERLLKIVDRFYDLSVPFTEGLVYDIRMQGNYTLKKLVDICSNYSYSDLDIYDGMEAVFNWRDMNKSDPEVSDQIMENLKEYCSLDAYGLFLVYRWLIQLIVESK